MSRRYKPDEVCEYKKRKIQSIKYQLLYYTDFDYSLLSNIYYRKQRGKDHNKTYNDIWIMADTESSRQTDRPEGSPRPTHICAWSIALRAYGHNIVTLYGHKPTECIDCIEKIKGALKGEVLYIYIHNLPWDWQFLRKFFFVKFGFPKSQLNIKSHYMINIEFENGLILKDSLILSQVSLEKWAKDLGVTQKAVGSWDYDKVRNQDYIFSDDELKYIECDVLAGVECLDKMGDFLHKDPYSMPYTATGIVRNEVRSIGKQNKAKDIYNRCKLTYTQYIKATMAFHGGFCHGNRDIVGNIMTGIDGNTIRCYDETSAYPFAMLAFKYPMTGFSPISDCSIDMILTNSDEYAFLFKLVMINPRLKDPHEPMPALQSSKCITKIGAIIDNGRILAADLVEIYLTEIDLEVIASQYTYDKEICTEVEEATKGYLPRWYTDYVFKKFYDKSVLKSQGIGGIDYMIAKGLLNSLYGMCVQRFVRDEIIEDYEFGEFYSAEINEEESYNKYSKSRNTILPYQWGVWVTAYAFRQLFRLGSCVDRSGGGRWLYSDTDSCYSDAWDYVKLYEFNNNCKDLLKANGYGPVIIDDKEYWLGVAISEGKKDSYTEFITLGSKRYCGRSEADGKLHITVAGVPKEGALCLNDNISEFKKGKVFEGIITGKKLHTYFYTEEITIDDYNNECGDSIDLSPCDYLLDDTISSFEALFKQQSIPINVFHFDSEGL